MTSILQLLLFPNNQKREITPENRKENFFYLEGVSLSFKETFKKRDIIQR